MPTYATDNEVFLLVNLHSLASSSEFEEPEFSSLTFLIEDT